MSFSHLGHTAFSLVFSFFCIFLHDAPARAESLSLSQYESRLKQYEAMEVSDVVVQGNRRIEKDAITAKVATKKGLLFSRSVLQLDIQLLFQMGYFEDIEVLAEPELGNKVKLFFKVKERPVVASIEFEGNEKLSSSDLKEVVKVKEWSILDVNRIREDVDKLQKHYEEKGFYLARVNYDVKPVEGKNDEVRVIFKVNDYDKVQIKKIIFLNNKRFPDFKLKSLFQETKEGGVITLFGSGSFKESAFKNDLQRLMFFYLDNGFVKFRHENPVITVSDDKRYVTISIYVEEGEQYSMGKTDFSGDLLYTKDELAKDVSLSEGKTFAISARNADIQKLTEKYQDLGYAFVNVIPKMDIKDDQKIVDIDYHFEKGNLVYIGEINISGNSKTHDKVIRRELRISEGQLFHGTNLRISKERVERLGYFQPGEVIFNQITRKGRDDTVDIEITIKERSTGTITLGAGYGSIQGFFFTTQIAEINLLGRGQNLTLQAQYAAASYARSFNLGFTEPYFLDTKWSAGSDLYWTVFPIPSRYVTRRLGYNLRTGYQFMDDHFFYITYKYEGMQILGIENVDPLVDYSLDNGILSSLILSMVRDKRNNRFETTGGNYQSVSVEMAGVGGDKRFMKINSNHRMYFKLIGDWVFRNSIEFGTIVQTTDRGVPPSEKYYLGGPNNMKGFNFFGLGPTMVGSNGASIPSGGETQFFSLYELEHPLIREAGLKFVSFFDVGNSWQKFPNFSDFTLRADWGFGIRWFSPIGPLRFEWGFPIAARSNESSPVFQFFIGQPF